MNYLSLKKKKKKRKEEEKKIIIVLYIIDIKHSIIYFNIIIK